MACSGVFNPFDKLPDDILLIVFHNLSDFHLASVRKVCKRFDSVSKDRELVRRVNFSGCYATSSTMVMTYLKPVVHHVESLNLNHCYWLSPRCCDTILRCRSLVSLHLLHLSISMQRLVSLLATLKRLQHVSITLRNVPEFQTLLDRNPEAQDTMRGVKVLTVQIKNRPVQANMMTMQFLAVTSFFEYCPSLEEFHVQGSFCTKGIPPYVVNPQIKRLDNLKNIHTMSVTDAIDPFARMFFFGALLEVFKLPDLQFRTLLQPLVVNEHLARKSHFIDCIRRIDHLQHLDISQTNAAIPNEVYQLDRARQLCYLNVADNSLIDSHSLQALADSCPHLASINLRDCHHLYFRRPQAGEVGPRQVDMSGLQSLVVSCTVLRHINVSGVHIHAKDLGDSGFSSLCQLLALNSQWRSLSLSPCCLSPRSRGVGVGDTRKRGKPALSGMHLAKRPRMGIQAPNMNVREEEEMGTELGRLVLACPYVEQFELIGAGFRSAFSKRYISEDMQHFVPCSSAKNVDEEDILCIRRWKHLRYLQLSAVPGINSGECLAAITQGCPSLRRLLLAHLGFVAVSSFQDKLMTGLPSAHNLTDLRIEQSRIHLRESFWAALSQMKALQRLCILSKSATFTQPLVKRFVQQVPSLVVLQLFVSDDVTLRECNQLQTSLVTAYKEERPALSVCIFPLVNRMHHPLLSIPDFHVETLTILSSTVCITPPAWDTAQC